LNIGDRTKGIFSDFYCDFTQINHGYIALMRLGTKCIYNLKNNENWRWNIYELKGRKGEEFTD
jgi:hypothetical protein